MTTPALNAYGKPFTPAQIACLEHIEAHGQPKKGTHLNTIVAVTYCNDLNATATGRILNPYGVHVLTLAGRKAPEPTPTTTKETTMTKPATTAALYVNGTFTDAAGLGHKTAHVATFADIVRWAQEHIARGHEVEIRHLTIAEAAAELEAMVAHFDALRAARYEREAVEWGWAR